MSIKKMVYDAMGISKSMSDELVGKLTKKSTPYQKGINRADLEFLRINDPKYYKKIMKRKKRGRDVGRFNDDELN